MQTNYELFNCASFGSPPKTLARCNDPPTSVEAACKVNTSYLEALVYQVIKSFPDGCIADDIIKALPAIPMNSLTPRPAKLVEKGLCEYTGEKRKTARGHQQMVVRAK